MEVALKDLLRRYIRRQDVSLTDNQRAILDKLEQVHDIIQVYGRGDEAEKQVKKQVKGPKGKDLQKIQIQTYIRNAIVVYSFETREEKLYIKNWAGKFCMDELVKARDGDEKDKARIPALLKELRLTYGYHLPDMDLPQVEDYGEIVNLFTKDLDKVAVLPEKEVEEFVEYIDAAIKAKEDAQYIKQNNE
ncbi:MAG: hypothetical protein ACRBFS_22830 [Aureispira sp.]